MTGKQLGECLKAVRVSRKLKQSEVAERLGIKQSTYSNYERGDRDMNIDLMTKFCEIFGITMNDLLGMEAPQEKPLSESAKRLIYKIKNSDDENLLSDTEQFLDFMKAKKSQEAVGGKNGA